jgi:dCTP deaminase
MSILCDSQIKELVKENEMITPFVDHGVREEDGRKIFSYGLGSYGYDIRLSEIECYLLGGNSAGHCDPKSFDDDILKKLDLREDRHGKYFLLPPFGYCLGVAEERLKLPRDVSVVAVGKSSYARTGIMCNITPAEAGWEGWLTLEISNCTSLFNRIYANEGITQLIFHQGTPCETSYNDRNGKYQGQTKEVTFAQV